MLNRYVRIWGIAAALAAGLAAGVHAQEKLAAADAWIALPADGQTTAMVFATINNPGMYDVYIVSGTTEVAEKIELHDLKRGPGAIDDVTLIHYDTTRLDATGKYLLLSGLKRPLKEGEKIKLTLKLDTSDTLEVEAAVKKAP